MRNNTINIIYGEILKFCKRKGLVKKLDNSMNVSEEKRFSSLSIDKRGLDILDAVHCVTDKNRTLMFLDEINKLVKKGDTVIEAGLGTGVLSFMASIKASKVYAFEINNSIYELSNEIKKQLIKKRIIKDNLFFTKGDIRKIRLSLKADIIISENIYTGMFFEKQIDIVRFLKKSLKHDGQFIPSGLKSSFFLCNINCGEKLKKNKLYVVSEMKYNPTYLSSRYTYDNIFFKNVSNLGVKSKTDLTIDRTGEINSLLICSDVLLPTGKYISRFDTKFMNNDILISIPNSIKVEKGDKIRVSLSYLYGSNPSDAKILIKKL